MSGEPDRGLMIELIEAMDRRDELATERLSFIASYKTALAERTKRVTDQDKRICEIREEMKAPQQSGRPILAAIAKGGGNGKIADAEARAAFAHTGAAIDARGAGKPRDEEEPETADERQRGPTSILDSGLPILEWAVHAFDKKSRGKRGKRLGTIMGRTKEEAEKNANASPRWPVALRPLVIGDEIVHGSALPGRAPAQQGGLPQRSPSPAVEPADRREVVISPNGPITIKRESSCDLHEPLRTYLVSMVRDNYHSEVVGRVVAIDPGRAVRKAKDRWGIREEYSVRELNEDELNADMIFRPREPFVPFEDEKIDPMAAADRRIASALIGPPDHKEDYVEKSAAKPPVIPPGDSTDDERKRRQVEYSSAGTPEPDEGISDRQAAAYVNRQSPPRPQPTIGPYNQDDALLRACAQIRPLATELVFHAGIAFGCLGGAKEIDEFCCHFAFLRRVRKKSPFSRRLVFTIAKGNGEVYQP